jgi:acetyltransferase-like isoleucine patch superfamily enzyme
MIDARLRTPRESFLRQRAKQNPFARLVAFTVFQVAGPQPSRSALVAALFRAVWILFWMQWAGRSTFGRFSTRMATWLAPPYRARGFLSRLNRGGYITPSASICHADLRLGENIFVDDRVVIHQRGDGGPVELGDRVCVHSDCFLETGLGGSLTIGADTHIQPRCQLMAYQAPIKIGRGVGMASNCALYPYDHGTAPGVAIGQQPLQTRGGIVIDDGAWLGTGVIVLSGVRIGKGAVVGAGSVVWRDVPDGGLAVGNPARLVKMREGDTTSPAGESQ